MDNNKSQYESLFRDQPVWKAIFSMVIPALLSILVMIFYNMADTFFIARLGDTAKVASVSIVMPVFSIIMALGTMLGVGGSTVISVAFGAGDYEKAKNAASLCFYAGIVISIIISIGLLLFAEPLLGVLGTQPEMWQDSRDYLRILAVGTVFMLTSSTCGMLIRSDGAIKEALIGNMAGTVTNILLDPLFILVFGWGVIGAAIATVLGNIVATCCYLYYIIKHSKVVSLSPVRALAAPAVIFTIIALGLPNAASTLLNGFASTFSNQLLSLHGTEAIAAMSAAGKSSMLISMTQMGICMGVQQLLAYNYGAKNFARLKETLVKTAVLTVAVGLGSAVFCYAFRSWFIGLFVKEASVIEMGEELVIYMIAGAPFLAGVYISTNFHQAVKKPVPAIIISILRQGLLLIPCLFIFHSLFGYIGIAAAHFAADIGAAAISMIFFAFNYIKVKRELA